MTVTLCLGDSLTLGSDVETALRWPQRLARRMGAVVINAGIDGDTTGGLLARFPGAIERHRPDRVLLLGGTNDLWWGVDPSVVQANLFAMVCQARHLGIAPIVATPLPLCLERLNGSASWPPVMGFDACARGLRRLAAALAQAAGWSEVPLVDFFHLFVDAADIADPGLFLDDGLHPNPEGHRLMAQRAAAVVSPL
jgi:acyl-CoA thioesterase-1